MLKNTPEIEAHIEANKLKSKLHQVDFFNKKRLLLLFLVQWMLNKKMEE